VKKSILLSTFSFAILFANAQLKIYPTTKNVAIGGTGFTPNAVLTVGSGTSPLGSSTDEVFIYNPSTSGGQGVHAVVAPATGGYAYASLNAVTSGQGYAYGVAASAYNGTPSSSGQSFGVYAYAGNASTGYNYGVWGRLYGSNYGTGILGTDASNAQTYIPGSYAGYFIGKIRTTNDSPEKPTTGGFTGYSDSRLKKDISPFKDGLEVLRKVNPITYKFNGIGDLPTTKMNIGVIAQDIQKVAPYCVSTGNLVINHSDAQNFSADIITSLSADSSGPARDVVKALTYNYDGLVYVLINSVKEIDSTVTDLQKRLNQSGMRTTQNNGNNQTSKQEDKLTLQMKNENLSLKKENEMLQQEIIEIKKRLNALETK
jgi:hypothetical protein